MFLCFLLGAGFIWLGGRLSWVNLSDDGRVSDTVLWLTALGIFWYAYETYQLKMSTSKQVDMQEEIMLNEFLPIIEPLQKGKGPIIKNGNLQKLYLRNLGKGPAKYVDVYVGKIKISSNRSLAVEESELVMMDLEAKKALDEVMAEGPAKLVAKIAYQDIYARKFKTDNIILDKAVGNKNYTMRHGTWDFKRLLPPKS